MKLACRVLEVSESGYYARRCRPPSIRSIRHAWLTDLIREAHAASRGTYGSRRVHAATSIERGKVKSRGHPLPEALRRPRDLPGLDRASRPALTSIGGSLTKYGAGCGDLAQLGSGWRHREGGESVTNPAPRMDGSAVSSIDVASARLKGKRHQPFHRQPHLARLGSSPIAPTPSSSPTILRFIEKVRVLSKPPTARTGVRYRG